MHFNLANFLMIPLLFAAPLMAGPYWTETPSSVAVMESVPVEVGDIPLDVVGGTAPYVVITDDTLSQNSLWFAYYYDPLTGVSHPCATYGVPAGLAITQVQGSWCITGTPSVTVTTGTRYVCIAIGVNDSNAGNDGEPGYDANGYYWSILQLAVFKVMSLSSSSLADAYEGEAYSASLSVTNGTGPYVFESAVGLPDGLTLNPDGTITGTPEEGASLDSPYVIDVTYSDAREFTRTQQVMLEVQPPLTLMPSSLPNAEEQTDYELQLQMMGGTQPYTHEEVSGLPPGMSLSPDGLISGAPYCAAAENGPWTVVIETTDSSVPARTKTDTFTLDVDGPILSFNVASLATAEEASPFDLPFTISGSSGSVICEAEGLPAGLVAGRISGAWRIAGTPSVNTVGRYLVTITLTESDAAGSQSVEQSLTLDVVEAPAVGGTLRILTNYLPEAREDESFPFTRLGAAGGEAPYAFEAIGLPDGLSLGGTDTNWWISGSAEAGTSGEHVVILTVTDAAGDSESVSLTMMVSEAEDDVLGSTLTGTMLSPNLVGTSGACALGMPSGNGWLMVGTLVVMASACRRWPSRQRNTHE